VEASADNGTIAHKDAADSGIRRSETQGAARQADRFLHPFFKRRCVFSRSLHQDPTTAKAAR
jgi:hypothetical protein